MERITGRVLGLNREHPPRTVLGLDHKMRGKGGGLPRLKQEHSEDRAWLHRVHRDACLKRYSFFKLSFSHQIVCGSAARIAQNVPS